MWRGDRFLRCGDGFLRRRSSNARARLVRAGGSVDAGVGQNQPLDPLAVYQMGRNNFVNIGGSDEAVTDGFGIDGEGGVMPSTSPR